MREEKLTRRILVRKPLWDFQSDFTRSGVQILPLNCRICHRTPSQILWGPEEPEALHYLLSLIAPCLVILQPRLEQLPSSGFLWDLQKDFYSYFLFIICMSGHFGPNTEEGGSSLRSSVLAFQLGGQEGLSRNITVALNPKGSTFAISVLNSRCT